MITDKGGQQNCILKVLRENANIEFYTPNCHSILRDKTFPDIKIKKSTFTEVLK